MKIGKKIKTLVLYICIAISVFLTIIPNAEIWNMAAMGYTDIFHVVVSIVDFIFEGTLVYFVIKYLIKKIKSLE